MWPVLLPLLFEWSAPAGCPTREDVVARTEKLLGRPLARAAPGDLQLEAHVTGGAQHWRLELRQRSSQGSQARDVQAASCDELGDAAALFVALSIDPSLTGSPHDSASASFASEPNEAAAPPPETTSSELAPEPPPTRNARAADEPPLPNRETRQRPPRFHAGLSIATSGGRLPGRATGSFLHGAVSHRAWLSLLELSVFPERRATAADSTAGGDLMLLGAGAAIGYMIELEPMSFGPVAGCELDWLRGTGTGVENPTDAAVWLLGGHAGARYTLALSDQWALLASGAVTVLANRPRFVLDGIGPVHQPERWGWRGALGLEWRSP